MKQTLSSASCFMTGSRSRPQEIFLPSLLQDEVCMRRIQLWEGLRMCRKRREYVRQYRNLTTFGLRYCVSPKFLKRPPFDLTAKPISWRWCPRATDTAFLKDALTRGRGSVFPNSITASI